MTSYCNNKLRLTHGNIKQLISKSSYTLIFSFLIFAGALSSCEEESTSIGIELLPGYDFVKILSTDTVKPVSLTYYIDSAYSNNKALSYMGGLNDPYFGYVSSDFVSQLRLTKKWPGGVATVDSVKLFFTISGAKGELNNELNIRLFEITELLSEDELYYSNRDPNAGMEIGLFPMPLITKDTVQDITIELPVTFGQYLIRDTTKLFQDKPETDFRSYFRGIYAKIEAPGKSSVKGSASNSPLIMALSFSSPNFLIRLYYHTSSANKLTYDFLINTNSVRYNRYFHDFTATEPGKGIMHMNDGVMDTLSYMQSFYGAFTRIKLTGLSGYRNTGKISVNKARLTIPVFLDDELYKTTTMPSRIYLSYVSSSGVKVIVPDYYVNPSFFDGTFSTTTKNFTFNLASFVQEYLEGRIPSPEVEMYLAEGEFKNAILKTSINETPARFEFTYTRF